MVKSMLLLAAALSCSAPKSEVQRAHIHTPRMAVASSKSGSDFSAYGEFRVDMSVSGRGMLKRPVLRLVSVCEVNGSLVAHKLFLDSPNASVPMKRSDIMKAYKASGADIPTGERDAACSDPARFTPCLGCVGADSLKSASYGSTKSSRGFFRLGRCADPPKLLLYRLELWQNGAMVTSWESSKTGLGKYSLPEDWHAWRKYPQLFKYVDVW